MRPPPLASLAQDLQSDLTEARAAELLHAGGQVMFDSMRARGLRLAAVLSAAILGGILLLGCNPERSLAPETVLSEGSIRANAVLELMAVGERGEPVAGSVALGRLDRPEDIAMALRALPAAARAELDARGTCTTSDAAFRAVVRELLGQSPDTRGVSAIINNSTWGRIKVHYSS